MLVSLVPFLLWCGQSLRGVLYVYVWAQRTLCQLTRHKLRLVFHAKHDKGKKAVLVNLAAEAKKLSDLTSVSDYSEISKIERKKKTLFHVPFRPFLGQIGPNGGGRHSSSFLQQSFLSSPYSILGPDPDLGFYMPSICPSRPMPDR